MRIRRVVSRIENAKTESKARKRAFRTHYLALICNICQRKFKSDFISSKGLKFNVNSKGTTEPKWATKAAL